MKPNILSDRHSESVSADRSFAHGKFLRYNRADAS